MFYSGVHITLKLLKGLGVQGLGFWAPTSMDKVLYKLMHRDVDLTESHLDPIWPRIEHPDKHPQI